MTPEKRKELHALLDVMLDLKAVEFCRIKNGEGGTEDELIRGEGKIIGVIFGVSGRANLMIRDSESSLNKAWTLEPFCINPTDERAHEYMAIRHRINAVAKEFNDKSMGMIKEGQLAVDALTAEVFGPPVQV